MLGKTIELYLVNGTTDSLVVAEILGRDCKALKLPRTEVSSCTNEYINEAGVYFLFCQDDSGSESIYIGEAEDIKDRLLQHIRDYNSGKEPYYWNTVVMFVGKGLDKAHTRYLEDKLVTMARSCNRCTILTKSTFKNTRIKDSHQPMLEEFVENVQLLISAFGYKALEKGPTPEDTTTHFYCQSNGANAKGFVSPGGFTIVKGSKITPKVVATFKQYAPGYFQLRERLEADGTIVNEVFQSNYEFSAPSAAAAVILGRNANGKTEWKTKEGTSLKDTAI